ncbi:hypothetical protein C0992_006192 [Termitomyces sp. T32_za158]|nr:hypothetical protein C0992_006192 [Termitomyces sp. T32_za158]
MAALHSKHTTHSYYAQVPQTYSGSWYRPAASKDDMPWHHMAHTYTWVVENEMDKGNRKTEQWIMQQQMLVEAENEKHRQACESAAQQAAWEGHLRKMAAERCMRRGEEAQRRAAEKEKKARLIDEEIRRIEARVRAKLEEERRKAAEERRRTQTEHKEKRRRMQEERVLEAWRRYEEGWNKLLKSSSALDFSSIPWPVVGAAEKAEDITGEAVIGFLFSHVHSGAQTRKERLRSAQLRWHPDRFRRVLGRVADEHKAEVERAVGIVARSLNDIVPY